MTFSAHSNVYVNNSATPVQSILWSSDGKFIISRSSDDVHIWEVSTGNSLNIYRKMTYRETDYDFYNSIGRWNIFEAPNRKYTALLIYREHVGKVRTVAWSPDGNSLASISADGVMCVWSATTAQTIFTYRNPLHKMVEVAWSPDGTWLASSIYKDPFATQRDKYVHIAIWDTATWAIVATFTDTESYEHALTLMWSPNGTHLATAHMSYVNVWNMSTNDPTPILSYHGHMEYINDIEGNCITAITWSPDGRHIASSGGGVHVWQAV